MKGSLFIVATPIGNLEDITLRALRILKEVNLIACEDTRRTLQLLSHYDVKKKRLISFFEGNERKRIPELLNYLNQGENIALVSNAGTPGISDPGYRLIERVLTEGIGLTVIPGPCAFVSALVASGLPTHTFTFKGFLPRRPSRRKRELQSLKEYKGTLIFYESPYRLKETLRDMHEVLGDRKIALIKELTKKFEHIWRGQISRVLEEINKEDILKGEYIIICEGAV